MQEKQETDIEIGKLLAKGVIVPTTHEGEHISPIFTSPKKDGTSCLILNLKRLNEHVLYRHFEMESLTTVLNMHGETRLLYGINRLEGCLLHCANCHRTPQIPYVSVASQTV